MDDENDEFEAEPQQMVVVVGAARMTRGRWGAFALMSVGAVLETLAQCANEAASFAAMNENFNDMRTRFHEQAAQELERIVDDGGDA